jgi:hypothetical protein
LRTAAGVGTFLVGLSCMRGWQIANMRGARLGIVAGIVALAILCVRIGWWHHLKLEDRRPVADLSVTSPLNQPGGDPAPADAYEVYSALYQDPIPETLVFVAESVTDIPQVDGSCLRPHTTQEHEMTDAFISANRQSHLWLSRFTIPQGYQLISRSRAAIAQSCMDTRFRDPDRCAAFQKVAHLRYLGVPGFNRAHTQALVSVVKMCGSFCGSGGLFVAERIANTWRRADATDFNRECSWMY